jgi:pimeloyl-ACP methyl ester carboxylesterase
MAPDLHARIFDRSGKVRRPPLRRFFAEFGAFVRDPQPEVPAPGTPKGDGHPVLVFPPFMCGDGMTQPLRRWLEACGYAAEGWGMGVNLGPTEAVLAGITRLVVAAQTRHGRKVSIVGLSLGGILAREAAKRHPDAVRRVITLCSPFRLPTAANVEFPFRLLVSRHGAAFAHLLPGLAAPPPVPTTAIYTRDDGIVAWQSCLNPEDAPDAENVEVSGAHGTIDRNPRALAVLADRLARPETPESR